jgi:hypothetical protein
MKIKLEKALVWLYLAEYAARFCPAVGAEAVTVHRQVAEDLGRAVQVEPMKPMLQAPGTIRLKL